MKYTITVERSIVERRVIEVEWPDGGPRLTTAHIEGHLTIAPPAAETMTDGVGHTSTTAWTVVASKPAIQPARIRATGRPRGPGRKRVAEPQFAEASSFAEVEA